MKRCRTARPATSSRPRAGPGDGDALGHVGFVGNIDYAEAHEGYQGKTAGLSVSAETKMLIESEVKRLIDEGYDTARAS
jgi:ATP-dependent Zn protease